MFAQFGGRGGELTALQTWIWIWGRWKGRKDQKGEEGRGRRGEGKGAEGRLKLRIRGSFFAPVRPCSCRGLPAPVRTHRIGLDSGICIV